MDLNAEACYRAVRARDPRFDGRLFTGVTTTGIYCRPICPAGPARRENCRYFPSAAAAAAAGFRPCLRCRPEASPGTPAWLGTSAVVSRALRLIEASALDEEGVEALALRLGVTGRHLRRLFLKHLGATPIEVALTRRLHSAKQLIDETDLPFREVAAAAGYGSTRRFNGEIRRVYARTPTALRRLARPRRARAESAGYRFRLSYRPPYDWEALLAFLRARAIPGVEEVGSRSYRRTIEVDGVAGAIEVRHAERGAALDLTVRLAHPQALLQIVERVRRLFDLGAEPAAIHAQLGRDPLLRRRLAAHPGIRTPGAWDGFELAVRAILGQQVTVRAASTLAGRVAALFGRPIAGGHEGLHRLFPPASRLMAAEIERAGVTRSRAEAIRRLARGTSGGVFGFGRGPAADGAVAALLRLPGVGEWTAQYIAMRAFGEPDAFPSGDLVLRRAAGLDRARDLERRAEAWRPWRAYAVMLLWQGAKDDADGVVHRDRQPHRTPAAGGRRGGPAQHRLPGRQRAAAPAGGMGA
jgi:AraC family transcriptional regulator of adaptative response / DNA-3-methyladenine glycosylase II